MGAASRRKGTRIEQEIVKLHLKIGVWAERYPLSGSAPGTHGGADVDVYALGRDEALLVCEVKTRGGGEGFKTIEKWLSDADALFDSGFEADQQLIFNEAGAEVVEVSFDGVNVHGRLEASGPSQAVSFSQHTRKKLFVRRTGAGGPAMNVVVLANTR